MSKLIGIRHENLYAQERRTPLTPEHVKHLISDMDMDIVVQKSDKRIFTDNEYLKAGARVASNLQDCRIILGVKEIPVEDYEPGKTYLNFAHVVKGQSYNMPRLARMMELGCNHIDYEKITDEQGNRIIFFGHYAGIAGMINSLWSLGLRLKEQGIETPFLRIMQAHKYNSLADARKEIEEVGLEIAEEGLPDAILPLTIGITGYGHTSQGAQEILSLLPVKEISPEKLLMLRNRKCSPKNLIYKVVFRQEHLSAHKEGRPFDKVDYYSHPSNYYSIFEKYLPQLTVLMNCMYWEPRFPRIVTKDAVKRLFNPESTINEQPTINPEPAITQETSINPKPAITQDTSINAENTINQEPAITPIFPKLTVIGDITCDPDGSIEITHIGTEVNDPVFVYNPDTGEPTMGYKGKGLLVMAVHILPSELPRESSAGFSNALIYYLKPIVDCNFNEKFSDLVLPKALRKALILHKGELTPDYKYLEAHLTNIKNESLKVTTT